LKNCVFYFIEWIMGWSIWRNKRCRFTDNDTFHLFKSCDIISIYIDNPCYYLIRL